MADGDFLRDVVFPLAEVTRTAQGQISVDRWLGTGFLVGNPQHLITATHVVRRATNIIGCRVQDEAWVSVGFSRRYDHPTEDITVFQLNEQVPGGEYFHLSAEEQHSSGQYSLWGYPEDIFFDRMDRGPGGRMLALPDLIYVAGHIRRRVSYEVPKLRGTSFYELSGIAGSGASGAPLISTRRGRHEVIGVYVGERTMQVGEAPPRELGYALRLTAVADWLAAVGLQVTL